MNKEEFSSWKSSPTTKEIIRYLDELAMEFAKDLARADYGVNTTDYIARKQAHVSGFISAVEQLAKLEFGDIREFYGLEEDNDKKI